MTAQTVLRIACDARGCLAAESCFVGAEPQLRQQLERAGWSRSGPRDYCPKHEPPRLRAVPSERAE